jgi:hypothetical protein
MASRGKFGKAALLMGAAAVAAGVLLKRDKVQALLNPGGAKDQEPGWTPAQPPEPSNYDAPGPPANTATPVPAPDPQQPEAIDEAAEEAAAAAEAANIGGSVSDYAGPSDLPATEAERPLAESGEGEAEGQEQAELDLETAAEPTAPGISDSERQIDDTIEEAANPLAGEHIEPVKPGDEPDLEAGPEAEASAASAWTPPVAPRAPLEPAPFEPPAPARRGSGEDDDKDKGAENGEGKGGSDWRTWSGRSINP